MGSVEGPSITFPARRIVLWVLVLTCLLTNPLAAQTTGPTVIDFRVDNDTLFLEISLNAEAFLTGLDPTAEPLPQSADYEKLRRLVSSELEPHIKQFVKPWMQTLGADADGPVALSYEGARIPVAGDIGFPRISRVLLTGPLPVGASALRLSWPTGYGPVVLRQQGVEAPYTGYLKAGETSPLIPLAGGSGLDPAQTLRVFSTKAISQVLARGASQVLLALALVFLSLQIRVALVQLMMFSVALMIGLVIGLLKGAVIAPAWLQWALPALVVLMAVWNVLARRLGGFRVLVVGIAGLLHGFGLSFALTGIGIPPERVAPAVFGFGAGVLLALVIPAMLTFLVAVAISRSSHRLRSRVPVVASIVIAVLGAYLWIAPLLVT